MAELLRVESLSAGYGEARVIHGVGFVLEDGRSLALLGRNGVGKTTLVDLLIGVTTRFSGRIALGGEDLIRAPLLMPRRAPTSSQTRLHSTRISQRRRKRDSQTGRALL